MVYKNVNRRILILAKMGLIEEIKYTEDTPHRRIEYRATMKGLIELIPDIFFRPEEAVYVMRHMEKFGLDKIMFHEVLADRSSYIDSVLMLFAGYIKPSEYQSRLKGWKEFYDKKSSEYKLKSTKSKKA